MKLQEILEHWGHKKLALKEFNLFHDRPDSVSSQRLMKSTSQERRVAWC